jgi:hypothetical protein
MITTRPNAWLIAALACAVSAACAGKAAYDLGYRHAQALGSVDLSELKASSTERNLNAERANRLQLLQQVTRAQQSEQLLLDVMSRNANQAQERQERIPHVTSRYRVAPSAATQPIPRCVFTAGWLRDFNAAISVPAATTGASAIQLAKTADAAPGTDAELLESGITPADILAHAQHYGLWVRQLVEQLNAVLDLKSEE